MGLIPYRPRRHRRVKYGVTCGTQQPAAEQQLQIFQVAVRIEGQRRVHQEGICGRVNAITTQQCVGAWARQAMMGAAGMPL